ncbi:MAG: Hsp20/alpha crystallin family protein [Candidatus Bathyarchaeia archaeon]
MNFDEIFEEMEKFHSRISEELFKGFDEILKNPELEGEWSIESIKQDGVEGFIARRLFRTRVQDKPLRILSDSKDRDTRQPLYDVIETSDAVKIVVELPGVEKDDIKIERKENGVEIEAKGFYTVIPLSQKTLFKKELETALKNGVLTITLRKIDEVEV